MAEGQTIRGSSLLVRYANFVKLPHTVFALPFAFLGVVAASYETRPTLAMLGWVVLAFASARFFAMGVNRIVDRHIDALNPRTRGRELPAGTLTLFQAGAAVTIAGALFVGASAALNRLTLILCPVALAWIGAYSFTKRWTSWSHLWLGLSLAIAPAGGYIALTGAWSDPWYALLIVAAGVALWVAGFDMFYALQDVEFDREHGLRSAVVALGETRGIFVAKGFQGVALAAFVAYGFAEEFGMVYFGGVALAAAIIAWEHQLVKPGDLSRLDAAFFTANGMVSILLLVGALGDRLW